jgi:aspartate-semialdehyde dehydrogenase
MFASARSAGKAISFMGKEHVIEELTPSCFDNKDIDIALFSAGGDISKTYAPIAAEKGIVVIDNSSAWRMNKDVPLSRLRRSCRCSRYYSYYAARRFNQGSGIHR